MQICFHISRTARGDEVRTGKAAEHKKYQSEAATQDVAGKQSVDNGNICWFDKNVRKGASEQRRKTKRKERACDVKKLATTDNKNLNKNPVNICKNKNHDKK